MGKAKHKIINWPEYNQSLRNRGSLTFWMDEAAIKGWFIHQHHGGRGHGFQFIDQAIEVALMLKTVFGLSLRATEGFINSLFQPMDVPLTSQDGHVDYMQNKFSLNPISIAILYI